MLPAPYRRRLFLGKKLPPEVQSIIIEHANPLTWFINDLFTKEEVAKFSEEIWRETLRIDWPGNLSRLPKDGFPTIKTGLGLVTSRTMYRRLCEKAWLNWITSKVALKKHVMWRWDIPETDDECEIYRGFIQIPLRQLWFNELPEWITEDKLKWLCIAVCGSHERLVEIVLGMLLTAGDENDMLATVATYCLEFAVESGNLNIVGMLLQIDGVDAGANGNSAVITACTNGDIDAVKLLISRDDVDPRDEANSAFSAAVQDGHLEVTRLLLSVNAYNPTTLNQATAIEGFNPTEALNEQLSHMVQYINNMDMIKVLLSIKGLDPSAFNNLAIREAVRSDQLECVTELLNTGRVDPGANDNEAIQSAARNGNLDMIKLLLKYPSVDSSAGDNVALIGACEFGHGAVVKFLLGMDSVDPSARDNMAIIKGSQNGKLNIVMMVLESYRVDPATQDNLALWKAAENGHRNVVEVLLNCGRKGVDAGAVDNYAIKQAAESGRADVVKL
ncbi:hypothetical protein HDU76_004972 [Blyttiomyces sp. JEL0837]|nr:hypothetical protein HDU76_004972 [Blyttiomyces sp. JEL0837]